MGTLRKYILKLKAGEGGEETFRGGADCMTPLDISFDVSYTVASEMKKGTVSVTGFSAERIASYIGLSVFTPGDAAQKQMRLTLQAGYEDGGMVNILNGLVVSASQSAPPNKTLTMEVGENWLIAGTRCSFGIEKDEQMTALDAIQTMAGLFGLSFSEASCYCSDTSWLQEKVAIPVAERGVAELLELVRGLSKMSVCVCSGRICVYGLSDHTGKADGGTVSDADILAITGVNFEGCKVRTFLRDYGDVFPKVKIDSSYNKHVNGTYMVKGFRHVGQYYGQPWWTEISCLRQR